jgi:hypothetical protein
MASGYPDNPSVVQFIGWLAAACPSWYDTRKYSSRKRQTHTEVPAEGSAQNQVPVPAEAPAVATADEPVVEIEAAFLKRAQLCASLLNATGAVKFTDMHELTAFSDYRLPQLLRGRGIMVLNDELEGRVESGELILEGSEEEVEIRAATVHISELILKLLKERQHQELDPTADKGPAVELTSAVLDYYLWKTAVSEDANGSLPAFHKTLTLAY